MIWLRGGRPYVGPYVFLTHWLDIPSGDITIVPAYKPSLVTTSPAYVYNSSDASVISICVTGRPHFFVVAARETRYADTDAEFQRLWLHTQGERSDIEPNPCG